MAHHFSRLYINNVVHYCILSSYQVTTATKAVALNCIEIDISAVSYLPEGAGAEVAGTVEYQKENETAVFTFPQELQV